MVSRGEVEAKARKRPPRGYYPVIPRRYTEYGPPPPPEYKVPPKSIVEAPGPERLPLPTGWHTTTVEVAKYPVIPRGAIEREQFPKRYIATRPVEYYLLPPSPAPAEEPSALSYKMLKLGKKMEEGFAGLPVVGGYYKQYQKVAQKYPWVEPVLYFTIGTPLPWNVVYNIAGTTASFEAWVSGEPPTISGEGIRMLLGQERRTKYGEYDIPTAYWIGESFGEYVQAVAIAKALSWGYGKLPSHTRYVLHEKYHLGIKPHLPSWRGSSLDIYLAKHWHWYYVKTGGIAPGEVAIPKITEGALSYGKIQAASAAFEMTVAPRTGGVWVGKYVVEPTTRKVLPHLISRGGQISIGYLREYGFERVRPETTLTPLVSQTQLTRMGIYPYMPRMVVATGRASVTQFALALGATTFARGIYRPRISRPQRKKQRQPLLAFQREIYSPLKLPSLEPREKEKRAIIPKVTPTVAQMSSQKVVQLTKQLQGTVQIRRYPSPPPEFPLPPVVPPLPDLGGRGGRGRRGLMYGAWFFKKHPIETPEKFARKLVGAKTTSRKRKKPKKVVRKHRKKKPTKRKRKK